MNDRMSQPEADKRIAIVIDHMKGGGAERVCLDLSRNFILKGNAVDLILCEFKGRLPQQIPPEVNLFVLEEKQHRKNCNNNCSTPNDKINWIVPTNSIQYSDHLKHVILCWPFGIKLKTSKKHKRVFPTRSDRRSRLAHAFSVYLIENRPDLVLANLCHSVFCTLIGREISAISVPVICSIHASQSELFLLERKVNSALLHKADYVHTVSKGIKNELSELNWADDKIITTIYNSVEKQRILQLATRSSGHPWVERKVKFNHKIILSVGRLSREKNYPLLIKSFANLAQSENLKLIILGEGDVRNNLQSLVVELSLRDIVSMPGWIANPFSFMRQTDVFVLSSDFEGFGNVLIEALACGCNIVSTDCPHGPREILDDGKFGELVPVDDEPAMTEAIAISLHSNPSRQVLVKRAEEFSPQRQIAGFEQMFSQVLDANTQ